MGKPQAATYKRSWRNYLLNSRYQLRFTLFMVVISAVLMVMLGWWLDDLGRVLGRQWPSVMSESESASKVGVITIEGATFDYADPARDEQIKQARIGELRAQETQLAWVLAGAVTALSVGLFLFGIKMTHRVAGPLYKIGLYIDKVKDGKYDKIYNLRKGDQLVEFFEHFREAHTALRKVQERDVAALKELIAAAEQHEGARSSPALAELRELLAKKEAGLG
jgi:hypothetical protein